MTEPRRYDTNRTVAQFVRCPACGGGALDGLPVTPCKTCNDTGYITVAQHTEWCFAEAKRRNEAP